MTLHVTWSQIETECGDYREGFVAIYRKYEGFPTDEVDGAGRPVKVTMASFARHIGVNERTFDRWVKGATRAGQPRSTVDLTRDVRRAVRSSPEAVIEGTREMAPADKARLAAQLLEDEVVAEHVVSDRKARSTVTRATDDYYQRQATERSERTERKAVSDDTDRRVDALLWVNRLGETCERFSREGNEALREIGPLPESERYWLTGAVDRAEATARAARRYLELGNSEFNAELEALLDGGA